MIGVTNHITTDVAAIPLLWVLPLSLYLLSFVVVFARRPPIPHAIAVRALPIVVLPLLMVVAIKAVSPLPLVVGLHLLILLVAALVCHGELARDRPAAARLTEFYLWLALGGALGGSFNALLAPLLFHSVLEYPIAIVLACLVLPPRRPLDPSRRARDLDLVLPVLTGALVLLVFTIFEKHGLPFGGKAVVWILAALTLPLYSFSARPRRFGLAIAAILVVDPSALSTHGRAIHQERTFFGVHRVEFDGSRRHHELVHGTTMHGEQRWAPKDCREALGYYHPHGPAGDVFLAFGRDSARIGIAGLGTGGLLAYARPDQKWTFWEIDPAVRRIASDTSWFCYIAAAPAPPRIVLGDARRSIAADTSHYDLIVLDAYTSDAIPVHLMTREALQLYLARLAPHGVITFHLSNRYFLLEPVVARLAQDARLSSRIRALTSLTEAETKTQEVWPSTWMVVARSADDFGTLAKDPRWLEPAFKPGLRVWTDDYSSLWSVLR